MKVRRRRFLHLQRIPCLAVGRDLREGVGHTERNRGPEGAGISGYLQFQPWWPRRAGGCWVSQGSLAAAVGRSQGTGGPHWLCLSWDTRNHFLEILQQGGRIQTSKDTAFVCPAALGSPSLISRLIFTFPSLPAQAKLETGRAENQGGKGWMGS